MLLSLPDQGELCNYEMLMSQFVIWPNNLWDTFSTNPDLILFVDGSDCKKWERGVKEEKWERGESKASRGRTTAIILASEIALIKIEAHTERMGPEDPGDALAGFHAKGMKDSLINRDYKDGGTHG